MSATPEVLPTMAFGHHFEILAAFGAQDAEAARKAMEQDIRDAADWYMAHVQAETNQ
jgi:DNA-binding GntR family transcriptional regulator